MNTLKKNQYKNELHQIFLKSAEILKGESGRKLISSVKKDIKVQGDLLSNNNILYGLKSISNYPILSEETGWQDVELHNKKKGKYWIVDPLDGTYNYYRQIPFYGMCIALWEDDRPILGSYFDIPGNKFYYGEIGGESNVNDETIVVSNIDELAQAVLSTGFPSKLDLSSEMGKNYLEQMKIFKKVRMLGSAAASLSFLAEGKLDVHFEKNTMIWDVASGIALVLASGGIVQYKFIENSDRLNILACNKMLLPKLKCIIDIL